MAPNGFPGGQAFMMLIPIAIVGIALYVLTIAMRDPGGRSKHNLPTLPNPDTHPLHHVRVSMAATKRKAKMAARKPEGAPQQHPPDGSPGEVRPFRKRA
ncbi:MAG: hypothetical protein ACRDYV_18080 [Acidimicrobiia bacterium]